MIKSGVILVFVFLAVGMVCLIQNASAEGCSACGGKVTELDRDRHGFSEWKSRR